MSTSFKFFLIISCLLAGIAHAQPSVISLTGRVFDAKTGQPLPFATVYINNTSRGTTADENAGWSAEGVPGVAATPAGQFADWYA